MKIHIPLKPFILGAQRWAIAKRMFDRSKRMEPYRIEDVMVKSWKRTNRAGVAKLLIYNLDLMR